MGRRYIQSQQPGIAAATSYEEGWHSAQQHLTRPGGRKMKIVDRVHSVMLQVRYLEPSPCLWISALVLHWYTDNCCHLSEGK